MQIVLDVDRVDALALIYMHELLTAGNDEGEAIWMHGKEITGDLLGIIEEFCRRVRHGMDTDNRQIETMIRKLSGLLPESDDSA